LTQIRERNDEQQRGHTERAQNVKYRSLLEVDQRDHYRRESESPNKRDHFSTATIAG
jgi:hypothetical protein